MADAVKLQHKLTHWSILHFIIKDMVHNKRWIHGSAAGAAARAAAGAATSAATVCTYYVIIGEALRTSLYLHYWYIQ